MPVVSVNLVLDDATMEKVKSGACQLYGLVKDTDSKKIVKHLPTIKDAVKEGAAKGIDVVRGHKKEFLVIGGVIAIGTVTVGAIKYVKEKDVRKLAKQFGKALDIYLEAAQSGEINVEIIDRLIVALNALVEIRGDDNLPVNISAKELFNLISSIYDYTIDLAKANGKDYKSLIAPKKKGDNIINLQHYLNVQKSIIEEVA